MTLKSRPHTKRSSNKGFSENSGILPRSDIDVVYSDQAHNHTNDSLWVAQTGEK